MDGGPPAPTLLVACFHAPPGTAVGGLRWWGLSRHLARRGWRVHLLTAQEGSDREEVPEGMSVQVVPLDTTLNDRYLAWKQARASARPDSAPGSPDPAATEASNGESGSGTLARVRKELGGLLSFPDEGRGWIRPLGSAMAEVIPRLRPDVVVSSGPPHSIHLGTGMGVRASGVPWVVDFRDPWAEYLEAHRDRSMADPIVGRLEAGVIRRAARIVTTTEDLAASLALQHRGCHTVALPNGVDLESLPRRPVNTKSGLRVAHLGTLYLQRDPIPVIRAFARFVRANPPARSDGSVLSFIGHVQPDFLAAIERAAQEEGVVEQVQIVPPCPREEALHLLATTGVSLVLAQDQKSAIPAKIYEAVGMGVPTLVITEHDSASAAAGRKLGTAVHEAHDLEGMARSLERAWRGEWTGALPDGVLIDYADLAGEAARILEACIPGRRAP